MKIGDLVRIKGITIWGQGREAQYAVLSKGDPLARIANIAPSGNIRVCDINTKTTPESLRDDWSVSSWLEPGDAELEIVETKKP